MAKKILFIFIIGLLLRLGYVLLVPQIDVSMGDSSCYASIARRIAAGNGYTNSRGEPDVYWAPGYPFFVSAIYRIFGVGNITSVRVVQSILSSLVVLIVYLICKKNFNIKIGLVACAITCSYPAFISYSGLLLPQLLAMFLISLFIFLIVNFRKNIWNSLAIGLIAGYSCLVRAELLMLYSIVFLLMIFINKTKKKQIFKFVIPMFVIMSFIISIWSFRNYRIFNKPVLVSTHYADTMWISTWKEEWLEWQQKEPYISIVKGRNHIEALNALFKAGINNIKEHPFIYLKMCTKRLYRLWLTGHSNAFYFMTDSLFNYLIKKKYFIFFIKLIMLFFNISVILLGFFGIKVAYVKFISSRNIIHYILAPILFFIILHFFTFATPRYAIPIMPFMIIFASCAIVHCWSLIKMKGKQNAAR